jgi:hypothetical protein
MAGPTRKSANRDDMSLGYPEREAMHANHQIKNHRPAPVARTTGPKTRKQIRVTVSTDGTSFTIHGNRKEEVGFELHFSTNGTNAEVSVHNDEPNTPLSALRLYLDRPA